MNQTDSQPEPTREDRRRALRPRALRVAQYVAVFACGSVAVVSLLGWLSGTLLLASANPAYVPMAPVSAIVFLLLSAALALRMRVEPPRGRAAIVALAGLVCAAMALTLVDIATGLAASPDRLFLVARQGAGPLQAGRMSPVTAVAFVGLAVALALFESSDARRRSAATLVALAVSAGAFVFLVGYAYDAPLLYGGKLLPVALPTSVALLLLGSAMAAQGVESWPLADFTGDSIRARLTRTLVPLAAAPMLGLLIIDAVTIRAGLTQDPVTTSLIFLFALTLVAGAVFRVASTTGNRLDAAENALRASEEALRERTIELERSNRDLEEFAYVASHDLQEPLRMVASFTQLLQRRYAGKLDADADEFIGFAVDGVSRMQTLIDELLAYARVGTQGAAFRSADLQVVLGQVIQVMTVSISEAGAVVTTDAMPTLVCDENQVSRVFQNLIGNAIKFRGEDPPRIHVGVRETEAGWEFCVSDNGIGIRSEDFDRAFTIFQRLQPASRYAGSGMGLTISKRIVERHGGRMWVESTPGLGSTFYFTLARLTDSSIESTTSELPRV